MQGLLSVETSLSFLRRIPQRRGDSFLGAVPTVILPADLGFPVECLEDQLQSSRVEDLLRERCPISDGYGAMVQGFCVPVKDDREHGYPYVYRYILRCDDCRVEFPHPYMVHDALWEDHGVGEGILCKPCLEARVGRPLTRADLSDVPLNTWSEVLAMFPEAV